MKVVLAAVLLSCVALFNASASQNIGSFWQVADLHTDEFYLVGSDEKCDLPMCCRYGNGTSGGKAGPFGAFPCDIPVWTMQSALDFVASNKPDFVVQSGDLIPHDLQMQNRSLALARLKRYAGMFLDTFPSTPVFHAIGNHDTFPVDQFDDLQDWDWLLQPLATDIYAPFLKESEAQTFSVGGYYSRQLSATTKIIVLNTQYGDPINFFSFSFPEDPVGQIAWLASELADARNKSLKVLMVEHIPFGPNNYGSMDPLLSYSYQDKLLNVIEPYSDLITTHISGHIHTDSFHILQKAGSPSGCFGIQHVSPSVTTFTYLNPEVREFVYDRDTMEILDVKTYYVDMAKANAADVIEWQFAYSMKESFGKYLVDFSCTSFESLRKAFWTDDELWGKFMVYFSNQNGSPSSCLDAECRSGYLCPMGWPEPKDYAECVIRHI
eukprot:ANDGO_05361.mRNA.1 Sphingomyelin phosphodiesterase A